MIEPKVSIIVPVYNIAEYLPACLDSILNQDFRNYELLIINDGSTDHSDVICDHYALKDNRIEVFHQANTGVSAARNLGLKKAKGDWICFVDGDDELYPNSLAVILDKVSECKPEMVIARAFINDKGKFENERYKFDDSFIERAFDGYQLMTEKAYKKGSVWGCIFKRDFLSKFRICFPLGLTNGEDSIFVSLVNLYVQDIIFIDQIFYLVNEREGSASRSWSFEKVHKMIDNIQFISSYIEENPDLVNKQIYILHYNIYRSISAIFYHLYYCFSFKNYFTLLNAIRSKWNKELDTGSIPLSKGKVKLLNISLQLFSITVLSSQVLNKLTK